MNLMFLCQFIDYCGDPGTPGSDNNCAKGKVIGDFSRQVGTARIYECDSLLQSFQSAIDYCPVQICGPNFYYTHASLSCGSKF